MAIRRPRGAWRRGPKTQRNPREAGQVVSVRGRGRWRRNVGKKERKKRGARETSGERAGALSSSDSRRGVWCFNACLVPFGIFYFNDVVGLGRLGWLALSSPWGEKAGLGVDRDFVKNRIDSFFQDSGRARSPPTRLPERQTRVPLVADRPATTVFDGLGLGDAC